MKRFVLLFGTLLLLIVPVLAVAPLSDLEMASAQYDAASDRFYYDGRWYDSAGYPIEDTSSVSEPEQSSVVAPPASAEADLPASVDSSDLPEVPSGETSTLIHSEDTSGTTQVNVFAIQTEDETGGTWIQGGSGDSLTESLFGPYTPYNASGLASVDWAWIADVVLFAILVICFFKIVAGVIKRV